MICEILGLSPILVGVNRICLSFTKALFFFPAQAGYFYRQEFEFFTKDRYLRKNLTNSISPCNLNLRGNLRFLRLEAFGNLRLSEHKRALRCHYTSQGKENSKEHRFLEVKMERYADLDDAIRNALFKFPPAIRDILQKFANQILVERSFLFFEAREQIREVEE